jgi:hypothetical protein
MLSDAWRDEKFVALDDCIDGDELSLTLGTLANHVGIGALS